ncbi:OprO/OprP family phosphate-selective porin [Lysobacter auxotrophicus]|uniref:OprO/OprP family phosphate-selective porin n=1 Tax=Lysobacter auxotrophicus TaxID=2992573 RepID=A0ABM8D933_9GAMM|nr:porin [Lysobacter auxotrophicus]BDU15062.1 OprO/OprP family phosphate-selective porin [Lysobacter auxotrophicus]
MPSIRTRRSSVPALAGSALACAIAIAAPVHAQSNAPLTVEELTRRLQAIEQRLGTAPAGDTVDANGLADLDQRLRVIERKLDLQAEEAEARVASTPVVSLSANKGLSIKSPPPGDVELKFRGLAQADGRFYIDDDANPQNDTFLWRRAQLTLEGSWGPLLAFRITPELAGDSVTLLDAWADLRFSPAATLRIGKTKAPVGLERLQASNATEAIELGFPSELAPGRDIGVQLQGELAKGTVNYVVGAYNGTVDGRDAATTNPDNNFEFAGRVFVEPWKNDASALSGLGFGIAGSQGDKEGAGNNFLPRYRTPGQVQFFNYRSAVIADGEQTRWSPQAYYYRNAFGLLGEYISSKQEVLLPTTGAREALDHRAWQLLTGFVLTGEDAGYRGVARPNHPFTVGGAGWGAWELVARYGELEIDEDAFPVFADPNAVAQRAKSWGLGVNWYLTGNFKLVANYTQTDFDGGAAAGADREDEKAFFTRAQFSF